MKKKGDILASESAYRFSADSNLRNTTEANTFLDWTYSRIKPYLHGDILDIGSGVGRYAGRLARDFSGGKIVVSDIDPEYIKMLKDIFHKTPNVSVRKLDLLNKQDIKALNQKFDCALVMTVLEHVNDDVTAIKNLAGLVKTGGTVVIIAPAYKFLYTCVDREMGHYRRYTKKDILKKLNGTGFSLKESFYFNFMSIFLWYFYGLLVRKADISRRSMRIFDKFIPLFKFIDNYIIRGKMGMTIFAILEKK